MDKLEFCIEIVVKKEAHLKNKVLIIFFFLNQTFSIFEWTTMHTFAFSITKICSQLFILFSVFSFFPASSQISLQILNSGLIEGYALPYSLINHTMCPPSVYSQPNSECYGGWARRAGYVEYIRNTTNLPTILLDIGQVFGRNSFSSFFKN